MNDLAVITTKAMEERVITFRSQEVFFDCDVADLYGVKTYEVNQAVKNTPDKFPYSYFSYLANMRKWRWSKLLTALTN